MDLEKKVKESWVVAFSCCFINCLLYGVARLSGMMMVAVAEAFQTNRASASLPFSVSTSVRNLSGFFVGYMGQRFGLRNTIAVGCGLASLGAGLCLFVADIRWMVICWGGIFGIGFGLATCLLPLAINQSFNRYRGIASGISYSGSYIGSFVFPSLVVTLLNEYGINGTLLVISGTFLNGCAVAFLFRDPPKKTFDKGDYLTRDDSRSSSEKEFIASRTVEKPNKLLDHLWQKVKCLFCSLKRQKLRSLQNFSSIYFISPRPLNVQTRHTLRSKSCCELISYRDSSVKHINKSSCLDYVRCYSNRSARCYFPKRMKKAKYKRKIIRIKFSLGATKKRFSFNKQFFHFPLENAKLVSFKMRKISLCCIKVPASNKSTETNLTQSSHSEFRNHPLKLSQIPLSKSFMSEECLVNREGTTTIETSHLEHKHSTDCIDLEQPFSATHQRQAKNDRFDSTTEDTRYTTKDDDKFADIESNSKRESKRTLECSLLRDAAKCLFGWSRLYTDPMFVVIAVTMSLHTFVVVCMITIIEDFAKDIGIRECQVHYVLMVLSIADLIGSLTLGFITDRGFLSRCNFIIICFFGLFVIQICISHARRLVTLLSLVAVYGMFESGIIITFPLLIDHYIPKKKQAVAVASSNILSSPTVLLVPLVIGYFRDMKRCYSGAFYSLGMTSLSCCCAWLLASCSFIRCKRREDKTLSCYSRTKL